ncbi:MAG: 50S ribosomal protein L16 [Candidatus Dojkabacteria bacterium]|jgi:large subunit ribosomal protein L16|nr:50S ribosomal protein L16 [Candidatus Dojkabacteria bacterium]MDD4561268.1 50S ribosomal protein L16 [Candidatus Dojkabacteria bacterium]NLB12334.1 50S ribosomal protein L16 [Candidatus Dojkabacteria bacterium]
MLEPRKRKYRKEMRGKMGGIASSNNRVDFGEYGLKSLESAWIGAREIEAARRAMTSFTKRKGKVWLKIFPHKPYTKKALNSKMVQGKGPVEGYVAVVSPGTVLIEIGGVDEATAREALRLAGHKFSVKTRFVTRMDI